jgi:hypothetical protein
LCIEKGMFDGHLFLSSEIFLGIYMPVYVKLLPVWYDFLICKDHCFRIWVLRTSVLLLHSFAILVWEFPIIFWEVIYLFMIRMWFIIKSTTFLHVINVVLAYLMSCNADYNSWRILLEKTSRVKILYFLTMHPVVCWTIKEERNKWPSTQLL